MCLLHNCTHCHGRRVGRILCLLYNSTHPGFAPAAQCSMSVIPSPWMLNPGPIVQQHPLLWSPVDCAYSRHQFAVLTVSAPDVLRGHDSTTLTTPVPTAQHRRFGCVYTSLQFLFPLYLFQPRSLFWLWLLQSWVLMIIIPSALRCGILCTIAGLADVPPPALFSWFLWLSQEVAWLLARVLPCCLKFVTTVQQHPLPWSPVGLNLVSTVQQRYLTMVSGLPESPAYCAMAPTTTAAGLIVSTPAAMHHI
jgi:hypothetical protein